MDIETKQQTQIEADKNNLSAPVPPLSSMRRHLFLKKAVIFTASAIILATVLVLVFFLNRTTDSISRQGEQKQQQRQIPETNVLTPLSPLEKAQMAVRQTAPPVLSEPVGIKEIQVKDFPVELTFLVPLSSQDIKYYNVNYKEGKRGFKVSFFQQQAVDQFFLPFSGTLYKQAEWIQNKGTYTDKFGRLLGQYKNYIVQAQMTSDNSRTKVDILIAEK